MKWLTNFSAVWIFLAIVPAISYGEVWHVPSEVPTIQSGIEAAQDGDTVLVSEGVYVGEENREIDFMGKAVTLQSASGASSCEIECQGLGRGIVFRSGETNDSVVQGFTIRHAAGGAIYCEDSSPEIRECVLREGTAEKGGGIYFQGGFPDLYSCTIADNSANWGGGIYGKNDVPAAALVRDCTIADNSATYGGGIAIFCRYMYVRNCEITGNRARYEGGGIYVEKAWNNIIGGFPDEGNYFEGNIAASGADLFSTSISRVDARYNTFAGLHCSDYYVTSWNSFDLAECESLMTPVIQDVYVSPAGDDDNDGLSWETAFQTIRHALSRVHSTYYHPANVHLDEGIYSPSATGESFPLPLVKRVCLSGRETDMTVIDAEGTDRVFHGVWDEVLTFSDLTIRNGSSEGHGGGMHLYRSPITISRCRFYNNEGSAVYSLDCRQEIENCTFIYNRGYEGAAIYIDSSVNSEITDSFFLGNEATSNGGALYLGGNNEPLVSYCIFQDNRCMAGSGGAIYLADRADARIYNGIFSGNRARLFGGAVMCTELTDPVIGGSPEKTGYYRENSAGFGADICSHNSGINATYNIFEGYMHSDYYVAPQVFFDLTGGISRLTPITQDVYVAENGDDTNDGLSWETPFKTIRRALSQVYGSASAPVTINMATGVYSYETTGEYFPLPLISHVRIQGRGPRRTDLDAGGTAQIFIGHNSQEAELFGLTLKNGVAEEGGGIHSRSSEISLTECIMENNTAYDGSGGAVRSCGGRLNLSCSLIRDNESADNGGGIYLNSCDVAIKNTMLENNHASGKGGGIYSRNGEVKIVNSAASFNSAVDDGGGLYVWDSSHDTRILNCIFRDNSAFSKGGGVFSQSWDAEMTNCAFLHNNAGNGGGIMLGGFFPVLVNCLFAENDAVDGTGGAVLYTGGAGLIVNSIIWDNYPESIDQGYSVLTVEYSDVQGGWKGEANISLDPRFVPGPCGDYYLSRQSAGQVINSPCIDSGDRMSENICWESDTALTCLNDLTTSSNQVMDLGIADMGFHYPCLIFNADTLLDY